MIVTSTTKKFLSYVGKNGKWLLAGVPTTVPDETYYNESFADLVDSGEIVVSSYDSSKTSPVVQQELWETLLKTLFKIDDPELTGTPAHGDGLGAISTSTDDTGSFTIEKDSILEYSVDGLYVERFEIPAGTYTFEEMAGLINGTAVHSVVRFDAGPTILIATKSVGANSSITMRTPADGENANDVLAFPDGENTSTTVTGLVEVTITGPTGAAAVGVHVLGTLWDAATDGDLSTIGAFQICSKGTFDALYANEIDLVTDENGELKFEVAVTSTGSAFLQLEPPAGYFLASYPSDRTEVAAT